MEINVLERERVVEIWLTNDEKNDLELKASLKPLYKKYKEKKYLVAVYESGSGDLFEKTASLLIHNRTACLKDESDIEEESNLAEDEDQGMTMMM